MLKFMGQDGLVFYVNPSYIVAIHEDKYDKDSKIGSRIVTTKDSYNVATHPDTIISELESIRRKS